MFVNIVRDAPKKKKGTGLSSLYECDRYTIYPVTGNPTAFTIVMEGRKTVVAAYDTTEQDLGVYVMNDRGRTINTIFRSMG